MYIIKKKHSRVERVRPNSPFAKNKAYFIEKYPYTTSSLPGSDFTRKSSTMEAFHFRDLQVNVPMY